MREVHESLDFSGHSCIEELPIYQEQYRIKEMDGWMDGWIAVMCD